MEPYHAVYVYPGPTKGEMFEEPVIVVEAIALAGFAFADSGDYEQGRVLLIAVAQKDGRHVYDDPSWFRCTEPVYLGKPDPAEADHPHEWTAWQPVLEGNRVVGMTRTCKVEGCGQAETNPTAKPRPQV